MEYPGGMPARSIQARAADTGGYQDHELMPYSSQIIINNSWPGRNPRLSGDTSSNMKDDSEFCFEEDSSKAHHLYGIYKRAGLVYEKDLIAGLTSSERDELAKMIRLLKRRRKLGLSGTPEEYKERAHYFTRTCRLLIMANRVIERTLNDPS